MGVEVTGEVRSIAPSLLKGFEVGWTLLLASSVFGDLRKNQRSRRILCLLLGSKLSVERRQDQFNLIFTLCAITFVVSLPITLSNIVLSWQVILFTRLVGYESGPIVLVCIDLLE